MTSGAVTALRIGQLGSGAGDLGGAVDHRAPARAGLVAEVEREVPVVFAGTGPRQHAAGVGDRDGVGAEDGQEVAARSLRGIRREAVAEVLDARDAVCSVA